MKRVICLFGVLLFVVSAYPLLAEDARLATPITMDCVDVRLHDVTDRLTKETGVEIRCGSDENDYTCRDIPVFVSAKALPLGTMLRALADVTHLELGKGETGEKVYYQIYRDSKHKQQIKDYVAATEQWRLDAIKWDWDKLAASGNVGIPDPAQNRDAATAAALANLAAWLGPAVRDRVVAGERVVVKPEEMPENIREAFSASLSGSKGQADDSQSEWSRDVTVSFYVPNSQSDILCISLEQEHKPTDDSKRRYLPRLCSREPASKYLGAVLKSRPRPPEPPTEASRSTDLCNEDKLLDTKIVSAPPTDASQLTQHHVLLALSRSLGYTIIREDYAKNHISTVGGTPGNELLRLFSRETTVCEMLTGGREHWHLTPGWRLDSRNRVIIYSEWDWVRRGLDVVPGSILDHLSEQLKEDGSQRRLADLIYDVQRAPIWILCFSLTPDQKSKASIPPESLTDQQRTKVRRSGLPLSEVNGDIIEDVAARYRFRSQYIFGLEHPATSKARLGMVTNRDEHGVVKSYEVILTWLEHGSVQKLSAALDNPIPIPSPERGAELRKKADLKAKAAGNH